MQPVDDQIAHKRNAELLTGKRFPREELMKKLLETTHIQRRNSTKLSKKHATVILNEQPLLNDVRWVKIVMTFVLPIIC